MQNQQHKLLAPKLMQQLEVRLRPQVCLSMKAISLLPCRDSLNVRLNVVRGHS